MLIEQFVDEKLGNSSYLIGSKDSKYALIIDPLRDIDRYLSFAEKNGLKITYVLETHIHSDFISGARELAYQTGAKIGASKDAKLDFSYSRLKEADKLYFGDFELTVIATPGHTPEHISYSVKSSKETDPEAIFSGGALIVGGAARTDLIDQDYTKPLAAALFKTIHEKFLTLPNDTLVYPTHGAGSFCSNNPSSERFTTIGQEKLTNHLLRANNEKEFIKLVTEDLSSYPTYYKYLRSINKSGPEILGGVPELQPLSSYQVEEWVYSGRSVLDVRDYKEFTKAHIPRSYGIQEQNLTTWAGWLIPFREPLVLVGDEENGLEDCVRQLIRIGYDELLGYLAGGFPVWKNADLPISSYTSILPRNLNTNMTMGKIKNILDVRFDREFQGGHIPGAVHIELGDLPKKKLKIDRDDDIVLHCQHGSRAASAASVLERKGYKNLKLLGGSFDSWQKAGFKTEK